MLFTVVIGSNLVVAALVLTANIRCFFIYPNRLFSLQVQLIQKFVLAFSYIWNQLLQLCMADSDIRKRKTYAYKSTIVHLA
jgi:hypothetical protein